jgi:hypothetical protein
MIAVACVFYIIRTFEKISDFITRVRPGINLFQSTPSGGYTPVREVASGQVQFKSGSFKKLNELRIRTLLRYLITIK